MDKKGKKRGNKEQEYSNNNPNNIHIAEDKAEDKIERIPQPADYEEIEY
jgi:hypothetical protein